MTVNGSLRYLHADQLGSTVLTTYTSGARESERGYYAFGSDRRVVGTPATDHRFTGQKADGSGLYYYNARYYDPVIGQFVSPDTIVPQPGRVFTYNRYMYVMGNPLKYTDPSGHCATAEDGSPDRMNDAECWSWADEYYASWYADPDYFSGGWDITPDDWLASVATQDYATTDFIRGQVSGFWSPKYREMGVHHAVYNPMPDMHAPKNISVSSIDYREVREQGVCGIWDCVAIGLDIAALGAQFARDTSLASIPVSGPTGMAGATTGQMAQRSLAVGSVGWAIYQASQGNASNADLAVTAVTTTIGTIPVAGEFAGIGQLLWDLLDPFHPW